MNLLKKNVLLAFCFLIVNSAFAQLPINIDQLSDQQLKQYLDQVQLSGLSDAQLEAKAKTKGLSDEQITKLKVRVANLSAVSEAKTAKATGDTTIYRKKTTLANDAEKIEVIKSKLFGAEYFTNANLTFEPNLRIPTPRNYQLGTGDEILVDVFGVSDAKYNLRVSEEGLIRIPYVSPIKVSGLTFEDAQTKIKQALSKVYPEILSGKTSIQVSLGQIRTIRVTLIGEITKPGTYNITSLASIANALYLSGGPSENGSFRNIQLIRNGKSAATFDFYDFLLRGDLTNNKRLEDEDIIKINPYSIRVELRGAIKRPAIYEAKIGDNLGTIVNFAGGFADMAYKEVLKVSRIGTKEKEILTVPYNNYQNFTIKTGDVITIDSITNRFKNRISIEGAVFHPGDYSIESVSTLKDLLNNAQLKENAFMKRGLIRRLKEDFTPEFVDFNVSDIITGRTNIKLLREDNIKIYSILDLQEKYTVSINGEVNAVGTYDFADSMKLQDLILIAGGLKDGSSAKKIDISRRIKSGGIENDTAAYSLVQTISLNNDLTSKLNLQNTVLYPFDIVTIRKDPTYQEQISVFIQGEVMYPGEYTLQAKNETLSDLIARAGGLKSTAYVPATILLRNTFRDKLEQRLAETKTYFVNTQDKDSTTKDVFNAEIKNPRQIVNIQLDKALAAPHKENDIVMEDGDVLRVPKYKETIQTFGGVYVPRKILYHSKITFKDVISESGGFLTNAARSKLYVQYSNGEVKSTKHTLLFFRKFPKIEPGAEVYVPLKKEKKPLSAGEIIGIGSAITGVASIIFGIINLSK